MTLRTLPGCFRCIREECVSREPDGKCANSMVEWEAGKCLSFFEFKKLRWLYLPDDLPDGSVTSADVDLLDFEELAKTGRYELYTQVDSEVDSGVVYLAGKHLVNRTGVYALVPKVNK